MRLALILALHLALAWGLQLAWIARVRPPRLLYPLALGLLFWTALITWLVPGVEWDSLATSPKPISDLEALSRLIFAGMPFVDEFFHNRWLTGRHRAVWMAICACMATLAVREIFLTPIPRASYFFWILGSLKLACLVNRAHALGPRIAELPRYRGALCVALGSGVCIVAAVVGVACVRGGLWAAAYGPCAVALVGYWLIGHAGRTVLRRDGIERDGFYPAASFRNGRWNEEAKQGPLGLLIEVAGDHHPLALPAEWAQQHKPILTGYGLKFQ